MAAISLVQTVDNRTFIKSYSLGAVSYSLTELDFPSLKRLRLIFNVHTPETVDYACALKIAVEFYSLTIYWASMFPCCQIKTVFKDHLFRL
jgi:hypothetical protein